MDPAELVKQPQDVTENPYRKSGKDGQKPFQMSSTEVCVCLCFFFLFFVFFLFLMQSVVISNIVSWLQCQVPTDTQVPVRPAIISPDPTP